MNITLDLKILKYLDDGLPSSVNGTYKNEIKVFKGVSGVNDIVDKIIEYFSEITVANDINFDGDSLSVTDETTCRAGIETQIQRTALWTQDGEKRV